MVYNKKWPEQYTKGTFNIRHSGTIPKHDINEIMSHGHQHAQQKIVNHLNYLIRLSIKMDIHQTNFIG
jgi:hypothetical protein